MKNRRDDLDWIEDYLDGSLNDAEQEAFNARLGEDNAFARMYEQRLKLQQTWKQAGQYDKVKVNIKNIIRQERAGSYYRRNIILVAASVVVLAGIAGILFFVLPDKSSMELKQAEIIPDSIETFYDIKGPQMIGMPKYGAIDSLAKPGIEVISMLSPADGSEFIEGDTIYFQWIPSVDKLEIIIKEKITGSVVFNITLSEDETEYKLETSSLQPGDYMCYVNDSLYVRNFVINKKP